MQETKDITIIGAGPTGLFAAFYAGMRGASHRLIDNLDQVGGQLTALYPEKYIFDVAGFPKILAKDLVKALAEQGLQWKPPVHLAEKVVGLRRTEDNGKPLFTIVTDKDEYPGRSVLIAGGIGAFTPRKLPLKDVDRWNDKGLHDRVLNPREFAGKRVLIVGGGDSAFDWAQQLRDRAEAVTLVHRSDKYRAHGATIADVQAAASAGRTTLLPFHELHDVLSRDDRLTGVTLRDVKAKTTRDVEADAVLPMLGFHSDIGALAEWGLNCENEEIVVNSLMETGRPGIYAAGDITTYPGKLKLIATGFGEAATAVNQAVHLIYPEKKVNPGHSSNMAIFGQKDD